MAMAVRSPWQWWILAAAVPICWLASRLTLDLWGDEVYTLYHFAAKPVSQIVSDYSAPNNHILYSLVLHPLAVSTQAEPLLRLPSFAFAVGTLAIAFDLARRLGGIPCAVAATLALGLNVMFLTHAVQLRGYGLSLLLSVCLMYLAAAPAIASKESQAGSGRWLRPLLASLSGAAFLYVLPTNALFLAPLAIAAVTIAVAHGGIRRTLPTLIGWFAAWPVAVALYWPVLEQVRAAADRSGGLLPCDALGGLVRNVYWAAGHDLWPLLIALPVVFCHIVGSRARQRATGGARPDPPAVTALLALLLAMLVGPFVACWLLGSAPFVRTFCPLLPALALGVGWYVRVALGDTAVLNRTTRFRPTMAWMALVLMGAMLLPPLLLYPGRLDKVRAERFAQDGYYNYYAADFAPSRIARYLRGAIMPSEDYVILFAKSDHYNLVHYLAQAGLFPPRPLKQTSPGHARARLFVVAPELAHWDELAELSGLPTEALREFPLVDRGGYYRVGASRQPVEIPLDQRDTSR